ncbi:hypothetical protein SBRY_40769 [Actinacidiphila bryophytorum]|uniref:Uncharacterized protein n=1 Tax=Actinacidiphila bryophytorum TaxID=1436133 RepID=A0A9W4H3I6_9ACTN|nr:hypothetical protein SBRY_40769 [Actinacidiphila bryophytorum]
MRHASRGLARRPGRRDGDGPQRTAAGGGGPDAVRAPGPAAGTQHMTRRRAAPQADRPRPCTDRPRTDQEPRR